MRFTGSCVETVTRVTEASLATKITLTTATLRMRITSGSMTSTNICREVHLSGEQQQQQHQQQQKQQQKQQ